MSSSSSSSSQKLTLPQIDEDLYRDHHIMTENYLLNVVLKNISPEDLQLVRNLPSYSSINMNAYRNTGTFMKIKTTHGCLYVYGMTDYGWGTPVIASYLFDADPTVNIDFFQHNRYEGVTFDRSTKIGQELFHLCQNAGLVSGSTLDDSECIVCIVENDFTTIISIQHIDQCAFQTLESIMTNEEEYRQILSKDDYTVVVESKELRRLIYRQKTNNQLVYKIYNNDEEAFNCIILQNIDLKEYRTQPAQPLPKLDLDELYQKTVEELASN
jgi:hypothetical protein